MGFFGSVKKAWSKAGAEVVLKGTLEEAYRLGLFVGGSPQKTAALLMDRLYQSNPDFLNKDIHPKAPRDEIVALGALMLTIDSLDVDSDLYAPFIASYSMLLSNITRLHQLSTLTILEAEMIDAAFDFLIPLEEARGFIEGAETFRERKAEYFA